MVKNLTALVGSWMSMPDGAVMMEFRAMKRFATFPIRIFPYLAASALAKFFRNVILMVSHGHILPKGLIGVRADIR